MFYTYIIRKEAPGDWRIWLASSLTGDLKETVGMFETSREAKTALRKLENEDQAERRELEEEEN